MAIPDKNLGLVMSPQEITWLSVSGLVFLAFQLRHSLLDDLVVGSLICIVIMFSVGVMGHFETRDSIILSVTSFLTQLL